MKQTKKHKQRRVKPSGVYSRRKIGYPMFFETQSNYDRLDAYAARHDKTMGGTMRELVWKFLENPVINRDELVSMGCAPHSYTGPDKTANNGEVVRSGISFVSDAPALVEKFDSIAREQKLRKSELLRYILRKSLK
ncbi:hypothetical protein D7Y57_03555 [Stenotrophomonas maltophilia]|jgi:hypothetical protein|uniref:hypothetical protein n=1 Tax=Stenotrophomonas maltophilia TaxID=40324 RepID=UPI0004521DFA|nr:hypothetical protein [Stenotrophomonas maltophilia]KDE91808.1 hypothetical protein DF40_009225 [Stenotrophomonas maltophilia M30]MBA0233234.1 hypothetical protein [Stenotrophomonas maltophilia]MBA0267273.1 hypothetical protein [Stenotrophomonas maltophilia]MBA0455217.1 hypothetical protein [Stenotrophomonas maltophilia]MCD5965570.1 hypothetical protein [Stenotrophomonas maltophilia]